MDRKKIILIGISSLMTLNNSMTASVAGVSIEERTTREYTRVQPQVTYEETAYFSRGGHFSERVHRALNADPALSEAARDIDVDTDGGITTLDGSVMSIPERNRVEADAASVVGWDRLRSKLTIK